MSENDVGYLSEIFPMTKSNEFRWNAYPDGAKMEQHILTSRWIDLMWWCEKRALWVYIATRANPIHEPK